MAYFQFKDEERQGYGSFETFSTGKQWWWAAGFPGCLHDSDPSGPFETEEEAITDAQEDS